MAKDPNGQFHRPYESHIGADWIVKWLLKLLDIRNRKHFTEVGEIQETGTLVTSNNSGIPIHLMTEGRSDDFRKTLLRHPFSSTPPVTCVCWRSYHHLLQTPAWWEFLMGYGDLFLGKKTVLCKDTPAFIANRIGVFGMMAIAGTAWINYS